MRRLAQPVIVQVGLRHAGYFFLRKMQRNAHKGTAVRCSPQLQEESVSRVRPKTLKDREQRWQKTSSSTACYRVLFYTATLRINHLHLHGYRKNASAEKASIATLRFTVHPVRVVPRFFWANVHACTCDLSDSESIICAIYCSSGETIACMTVPLIKRLSHKITIGLPQPSV